MGSDKPTVYIVDDDPAVRDSLQWLVESVNLPVKSFASGMEFLDSDAPSDAGCLILDIRMPGMSGIDVFEELENMGSALPVVFLTGHGDVHWAVRAMKAVAFDFVEKPFNDQVLLDLVQNAIRYDRERASEKIRIDEIKNRLSGLTAREREVLDGVVGRKSNKIIARDFEPSEKTIEFHRAKMIEKMEASSLANLIKMVTIVEKSMESA
ncbi:MAG: response regulator [Rhodospirillaceae bacterium]